LSPRSRYKAKLAIPRSKPRLPPTVDHVTSSSSANLAPQHHTAPIVDIIAVPTVMTSSSTTDIPKHYHPVEHNNCHIANLAIYIRREHNWDRAHTRPVVTSLTVIHPDRGEFVPPGYCVVRRAAGANLAPIPANLATGGERQYLCFRRGREGNPVTGIQFITPPANIAQGYTIIERTPFNFCARIGAVWVCIRQRLANLELLRPHTLNNTNYYYSTGGSVVPSANLGTCHVMDRSTHHLLSPAGLGERLDEASLTTRSSMSQTVTVGASDDVMGGYISTSGSYSTMSVSEDEDGVRVGGGE